MKLVIYTTFTKEPGHPIFLFEKFTSCVGTWLYHISVFRKGDGDEVGAFGLRYT